MVQPQSRLRIGDNTGAKEIMCIRVLGGTGRKYAGIGDIIVASVKKSLYIKSPFPPGAYEIGKPFSL